MATQTIYIKDDRVRQDDKTTPQTNDGGNTSPAKDQKENNDNQSPAKSTAVVGGLYLFNKVVETATQIGMYEVDKIGSRQGLVAKQVQIQNTLNRFGVGKKGMSYGKAAITGAVAGAALGSVIPGFGTVIGAGIGATIGLVSAGVGDYINFDKNRYQRERNNYEIRQQQKQLVWSNSNNRFAGTVV